MAATQDTVDTTASQPGNKISEKLREALGRLTNQQLADAVGLSASQCSRRRTRLEADGIIAGYHADLASARLGFNVVAFVHIPLATHSPDNAKPFRDLVQRVDDVQEAYALTGDADYLLKIILRDLKSLSDIVNNVLMPHPSVAALAE